MALGKKNNIVFLVFAFTALLAGSFYDSLADMFNSWMSYEEYSHGLILPFLSLYLIWLRRDELLNIKLTPSWFGLFIVVISLLINSVARMAAVFSVQQYAFVLTVYGLVICLGGFRLFRLLIAPMLLLMFMVPPPNFFMNNLSAHLQLISSQLGVLFIRIAGVSVYLEGNVIDLGVYKLQVAEACSGLRYLFPLMTMGFFMAYLFRAPIWKRMLVFLSSIPLTIVMNSLRIGVIGVLVEYWGISMAEGFLHDFEGWVVFMFSCAVLLLEMKIISGIGSDKQSWTSLFSSMRDQMNVSVAPLENLAFHRASNISINKSLLASLVLLIFSVAATFAITAKEELLPQRASFSEFPQNIGSWQGHRSTLESVYLDVLKLDDYVISDFVNQDNSRGVQTINFYSAWYNSQRAGQSAHSPRTCLPGGGWIMSTFEQVVFKDLLVSGKPLQVNRSVIVKGSQKQLVYYWFQQRGRTITNEYKVKWFIFWDSLTKQRSDGALVRLVVPVLDDQSLEQSEADLQHFLQLLVPTLKPFIPE